MDGQTEWLTEGAAVTYVSFLYDRPVAIRQGTVVRVLKRDVVVEGLAVNGAKPFRFAPGRNRERTDDGEIFYRLRAENGSTTEEIHRSGSRGAARLVEDVRTRVIVQRAKQACDAASKNLTRITAADAIERLRAWLEHDGGTTS